MFEATLAAQSLDNGERRIRSLSTAIAAHAAVLSAIIFITAMIVPKVTGPEPPTMVIFPHMDMNLEIAAAPHDPAPAPSRPSPATGSQPVTPVPPRPIEQPRETPNTISEIPTTGAPGPDLSGGDGDSHGDGDGDGLSATDGDGDGNGGGGGGGGVDPGPHQLTEDMIRPVLVSKVEPIYPKAARMARLEGRVVVEAVVGLDGHVESVTVLSSSNSLFDEAAITAVRKWAYTPAKMNGSPVRVYFTVQVSFVLR